MKKIVLVASLAFMLGMTISCKHSADWCAGKVITIDTTTSIVSPADPITKKGSIDIDTTAANILSYVKSNIKRRPYYGSVDGGKTWTKLPLNDTLPVGTYQVVVKDGDGCESQVYSQTITY